MSKHVPFVHLHCHTEYSLLDGCNKIPELVARAKELNQPAIAMTDHGVMCGTVQFYKECVKQDVKPLIGCEVYVAPRKRTDKQAGVDSRPYHFTLLAKDPEGYKNLITLVSKGHLEGYYYKPRVDRALLEEYSNGLVALSGCLRGEVNDALLCDNFDLAKKRLGELKDIYKDNFYVELMDHGIPEQKRTNVELIKLARMMNLPLVATNDTHYGTKADACVQDTLVCIQTGKLLNDTNRMKFFAPEFYLKSGYEMAQAFSGMEEALTNTLEVAERCNMKMDLDVVYLPDFPLPEGHTYESYVRELCRQGFLRIFGTENPGQDYLDRLETELEVINGKGFAPYFLIIWDFIKYARDNGIPVGPGRGSAAGSLTAYLMDITTLDPMKHGLLFERFLNPERTELPDVDTDFCVERREEVINYCRRKYGHDKVAQIMTFGRLKARAALRDVGRVMDIPLAKVDKIAKTVPEGPKVGLKDALDSPEFKKMVEEDAETREMVELALKVEGMARNAGVHAAGVVMSSQPIYELVPLSLMSGEAVAQFDMNDCADVGLVKMDFLGLRNLTVIENALQMIEKTRGFRPELEPEGFTDEKTYQLLCEADTNGVFQLESDGMKRYLKQLQPDKFSDIVAFLALYRPGPLQGGVVDEYIRRRHGKGGPVVYPHDKLKGILEETYGFFLYQEQVMLTANILAGYTMAMADQLRKAMGKKKMDVMAKHRQIFTDGAVERGVDRQVAADIFETMEKFAAYGFNKSHSAAYGIVTYHTAYLKANYREEYMAAVMTSVLSSLEKVSFFVKECTDSGIEVLPPCVNESEVDFVAVPGGNRIRWGMAAVRNVGRNAVENILENREKDGPYKDLADLCNRVDLKLVNKRVLEGLIKSGGMDCFGETRATLLANFELCHEHGARAQKEQQTGQFSLFEALAPTNASFDDLDPRRLPPLPKREMLEMEREMLGIYLSDSPLSEVKDVMEKHRTHKISALDASMVRNQVKIAGMVIGMRKIMTRFNTPMAFLEVEDFSGSLEVVVRPAHYEKAAELLQPGALLLISGRVDLKQRRVHDDEEEEDLPDEEVKVQGEEFALLDNLDAGDGGRGSRKPLPGVHIKVQLFQSDSLPRLRSTILKHRGDQAVYLHLCSPKGVTVMNLSNTFCVKFSEDLKRDVSSLLGREALWAETPALN